MYLPCIQLVCLAKQDMLCALYIKARTTAVSMCEVWFFFAQTIGWDPVQFKSEDAGDTLFIYTMC